MKYNQLDISHMMVMLLFYIFLIINILYPVL